ncbi:MAG: GIY-YIG nuclease family protein [Planctomycetota bacterium]|nr:GIY-YIG nuclease family protein [Planctomycetota bacterium]
MAARAWWVYLVRCADGSLYAGIATNVARRLEAHRRGRGAKYLRGKGRLDLVLKRRVGEKGLALSVELRIKRLPKAEKEALLSHRTRLGRLVAELRRERRQQRNSN